jgi:hypothetical protein
MDGELPGVEHRQIHEHLAQCEECRVEYASLLQTKRLLAALRIQEPRPELPTVILHQITLEQSRMVDRSPLAWFQERKQRFLEVLLQEVKPSSRTLALGVGLAVVGIVFASRAIDASDDVPASGRFQWTHTDLASMGLPPAASLDSVSPKLTGAPFNMTPSGLVSLHSFSEDVPATTPTSFPQPTSGELIRISK